MYLRQCGQRDSEDLVQIPVFVPLLLLILYVPLLSETALLATACVGIVFALQYVRFRGRFLSLSFGILIPLIPFFGSGSLLVIGYIYLAVQREQHWQIPRAALPYVFLLLSWLLTYVFLFDGQLEQLFYALGLRSGIFRGAVELQSYMSNPLLVIQGLKTVLRIFLLLYLFAFLGHCRDQRELLWQGVCIGMLFSAGSTVALSLTDFSWIPQSNHVWEALGRNPGTFSDPNAMGIFSGLLAAYCLFRLYEAPVFMDIVAAGAAITCGVLSGSRSFYLALILAIVLLLRKLRLFYAFVLLGSLFLLLPLFVPADYVNVLPLGLQRVLATIHPDTMIESLFSRKVFFAAAVSIIAEFPLFGIGPGRFHLLFPDAIKILQIPLGTWTDNANNFYLAVLSETGLLGLCSLLIFIFQLSDKEDRFSWAAKSSLIILLAVLFFGPHLQFSEVSILFALLLSGGCVLRQRMWSRPAAVVLALLCLLIPLRGLSSSYGLYPWEFNEQGTSVRWLASRAQFFMRCSDEGTVSFLVRSLDPTIRERPLTLTVAGTYERKEYALATHDPTEIVLSCPGHGTNVRVWSSRMWIPHTSLSNKDYRRLSVQLLPVTDTQHQWLY